MQTPSIPNVPTPPPMLFPQPMKPKSMSISLI